MSNPQVDIVELQRIMDEAVEIAKNNHEGDVANYIPELASASEEMTAVSITLNDGTCLTSGNNLNKKVTLQSCAKIVILIGLLEELGVEEVMKWVKVEPSGDDFASIARLDQFGPKPSNPMLNSGAISLSGHIQGTTEERLAWLDKWMQSCFGTELSPDSKVFVSERRTGDRNRSLAYLLKSRGMLIDDVDDVLETYFYLCSYEVTVKEASYLPMLLANRGVNPHGEQVFSAETSRIVNSIVATCGIYNETGTHMVRTGMPAKSSVSGYILAVALRHGGIATLSPRVNPKGTSMRGEIILHHISKEMGWHFAG